jgi:hypothetical protein
MVLLLLFFYSLAGGWNGAAPVYQKSNHRTVAGL